MLSQSLPPEVVEHVLHRGCAVSRQFCLALCLVSSWTRRLALPYLYSTVVLETQSSISSFYHAVARRRYDSLAVPPACLYVYGLWVKPISNVVVDIFNACENLEYISVHEENLLWLIRAPFGQNASFDLAPSPEMPPASNKNLHLWVARGRTHKWSMYPMDTITTTLPSPFLSKVTHLRLDCSTGYNILKNIKRFVRLAYLAVAYDGSPSQDLQMLVQALRAAPVRDIFCVLILMVDVLTPSQRVETLSWVASLDISQKIHVLPSRSGNLQAEWEEEIRTGITVWRKVELKEQQEMAIFGEGSVQFSLILTSSYVCLGGRR